MFGGNRAQPQFFSKIAGLLGIIKLQQWLRPGGKAIRMQRFDP